MEYERVLTELLHSNTNWLDVGCGENLLVQKYYSKVQTAIGVDVQPPAVADVHFQLADMRNLPFPDNYADLVTLRFVVEHVQHVPDDLNEIFRVLKPNGLLLILTTNLYNPFVFIPRLLPYSMKHRLITTLFKVRENEVFQTYHRLNTLRRFKRALPMLRINRYYYFSDINTTNSVMFILLLCGISLRNYRVYKRCVQT